MSIREGLTAQRLLVSPFYRTVVVRSMIFVLLTVGIPVAGLSGLYSLRSASEPNAHFNLDVSNHLAERVALYYKEALITEIQPNHRVRLMMGNSLSELRAVGQASQEIYVPHVLKSNSSEIEWILK